MKIAVGSLLAVALLTLAVTPVAAGKGVNSIVVDQADLHFGDTVTFTASVETTVKYEFVRTDCWRVVDSTGRPEDIWYATSQDILTIETGSLVTLKNHIGLTAAHDPGFVLGATYEPGVVGTDNWDSGGASCRADIFSFPSGGVIATTTYQVAPQGETGGPVARMTG